ncbi:MAG: rhodanese-like domain-containing protein [Clostridiales bacterium]|nr:rhodanese-like domain-containing protein [Clostridiales bacterium]
MTKIISLLLSMVFLTGCSAPVIQGENQGSGAGTEQDSAQEQQQESKNETIKEATYRQITMSEAIVMMEEESGYIILDVRTHEEFNDKHIPGAICIPNETIGTEDIPELPDKDRLIMVYCRSGNRSKQASKKLAALGYTNIVEFGGIIDWPGETISGAE